MPKLPRITSKKLLKALKKYWYIIDHQTWSHIILYHEEKDFPIVVPNHTKDLKTWTLSRIIKDAWISVKELIELL